MEDILIEATARLMKTDDITNIARYHIGDKLNYSPVGFDPHVSNTYHVYMTVDEPIKKDDWYFNAVLGIRKCVGVENSGNILRSDTGTSRNDCCYKIVASTDLRLINIPQPSQIYLESLCKGGFGSTMNILCFKSEDGIIEPLTHKNIVSLFPIIPKDTFTLDEMQLARAKGIEHATDIEFNDWIKTLK